MAILRCTKKLLSELNQKPVDCEEPSDTLSGWHSNLIRVDRRKCILFTHDKTLYTIFVPGLRKPDYKMIKEIFGQNVFKSLIRENILQGQIEIVLDNIRDICFAKTNNRSVLGSMNDLTFQLKSMIAVSGGLANTDIVKLNHNLNRIPMSSLENIYAIDEIEALLEKLSR